MNLLKAALKKTFNSAFPHMRELGWQVLELESDAVLAKVRYGPDLVGDPRTGVLHGGVVTSLLDSAGGLAVLARLGRPLPLATLDLRIDYMRPSKPGLDVFGRVECFQLTRNVAFTRGVAYDADPADPVAAMTATYMLNTQRLRRRQGSGADGGNGDGTASD